MKKSTQKKVTPRSLTSSDMMKHIHCALKTDLQPTTLDPNTMYLGQAKVLPSTIFSYRQVNEFYKKFVDPTNEEDATRLHDNAISDFLDNCIRLAHCSANLDFPDVQRRLSRSHSDVERVLLRSRALIHGILSEFPSLDAIFEKCKHGPGSTVGLSYIKTNLEDKFQYPLSCTVEQRGLFELYLQYDPQFFNALCAYNGLPVGSPVLYDIVEGSVLTTVVKNQDERRTIAKETTVGMFFQQAVFAILLELLLPYLDIRNDQSLHQYLAYFGSVTQKLATLDWKKASDSVLRSYVKWAFPPQWYCLLDLIGSKKVKINDTYVDVPMMSTMGNATTFPVETLIFYAIGVAACTPPSNSLLDVFDHVKKVNVFGDDCILPSECAPLFIEACEYIGFSLNSKKSYVSSESWFRESCGADFYNGRNVRPFCPKGPQDNGEPQLESFLYICYNRLKTQYISYFGPLKYVYTTLFSEVFPRLFSSLGCKVKLVPDYFPDDAGLQIFDDLDRILRFFYARRVLLSPVYVNKHGSIKFDFLRFIFLKDLSSLRSNSVRYWEALKYPKLVDVFDQTQKSLFEQMYQEKQGGFYVVSSSVAFCYSGPKRSKQLFGKQF